nr:MAG TPA: hypothetical protein [Caudoviricetes sp.]
MSFSFAQFLDDRRLTKVLDFFILFCYNKDTK